MLASAPLAGYFTGEYLSRRIIPGRYTALIFSLIGLLAGLVETARIIRAIVKIEKGI